MEYLAVSIYIESFIATCLTQNIIMIGGLCCQKKNCYFCNIDMICEKY